MEIRKRIKAGFFRRKPRIDTDRETQKHIKDIADSRIPTPMPYKKLKSPIFKRSGFKRISSFIIGGIGLILELIPEYSGIGRVVMYFAGGLGIVGTADGIRKNKKADDKTQIIKMILVWIWGQITKLLTSKKEQSNE